MKTCSKCHRTLPETDFYQCLSAADGFFHYCKDCTKAYNKKRYHTMKAANEGLTVKPTAPPTYSNPDLAAFTPRQLIKELRARGYTGTLKYTQEIKL